MHIQRISNNSYYTNFGARYIVNGDENDVDKVIDHAKSACHPDFDSIVLKEDEVENAEDYDDEDEDEYGETKTVKKVLIGTDTQSIFAITQTKLRNIVNEYDTFILKPLQTQLQTIFNNTEPVEEFEAKDILCFDFNYAEGKMKQRHQNGTGEIPNNNGSSKSPHHKIFCWF